MSIVNNSALSRFFSKSKTYIDDFYNNYTNIYGSSSISASTTNADYRILYQTSDNTDVATCSNGLITIQKTGTYYISARLGISMGSTSGGYLKHTLFTNASIPSNTSLITGTVAFTSSVYVYGYSSAIQGPPIFDLLYLTSGTVIGFGVAKTISGTSTLSEGSNGNTVMLLRVSSANLLE